MNLPSADEITVAFSTIRRQTPWINQGADNVTHHRVLPYATYSPWINDDEFLSTYNKIKAYTLVDVYRCYELWSLAKQLTNVKGHILEVGVWRGGTGALLASAVKDTNDKSVYLADTFTGVVKAGEHDTNYKGGEHADTSKEIAEELINSLGLTNTHILQGIFPEDTSDKIIGNLCLLHCDVDVYSSAKDIVNWATPRMVTGGIVVFDDYGFYGCEGITKLVNQLKHDDNFLFVHNLNGHALLIKQ